MQRKSKCESRTYFMICYWLQLNQTRNILGMVKKHSTDTDGQVMNLQIIFRSMYGRRDIWRKITRVGLVEVSLVSFRGVFHGGVSSA